MITWENITLNIKRKSLLNHVSGEMSSGEVTMILGPNGAGKSTLLKCISGLLPFQDGFVWYNNKELFDLSDQARAKTRAILLQTNILTVPFTAEEVVMMGRYNHFDRTPSEEDREMVLNALKIAGVEHLKDRIVNTMSGGEQQRVHFARVLAQIGLDQLETKFLLLDEPVAALDVQYQYEILQILQSLAAKGLGILAVMHDINLALQFSQKVILMKDGQINHMGRTEAVLTPSILEGTYGIPFTAIQQNGQKWLMPSSENPATTIIETTKAKYHEVQ